MKKIVLCAASYYEHKLFFNEEEFSALPSDVKKEAKSIVETTADKVRGIVIIGFYENSNVYIEIQPRKDDMDFDDIAAKYEVNRVKKSNKKFFGALMLWYKVVKLGAKGIAIK